MKFAVGVAAASTLALGVALVGPLGAQAAPGDPDLTKAFVCKYVGTPGVEVRLQTGNNPISVDCKEWMEIGTPFNDSQGRSIVIAWGYPGQKDEPGIDQCPPPIPRTRRSPRPRPRPPRVACRPRPAVTRARPSA